MATLPNATLPKNFTWQKNFDLTWSDSTLVLSDKDGKPMEFASIVEANEIVYLFSNQGIAAERLDLNAGGIPPFYVAVEEN